VDDCDFRVTSLISKHAWLRQARHSGNRLFVSFGYNSHKRNVSWKWVWNINNSNMQFVFITVLYDLYTPYYSNKIFFWCLENLKTCKIENIVYMANHWSWWYNTSYKSIIERESRYEMTGRECLQNKEIKNMLYTTIRNHKKWYP
jgi:hypothetical protein